MSDENTKVMSADDFAVYSAKVNEWHDAATPLVNAISTKKQKNYASFDLQQITMLLEQMADESPTSELKQRIHLTGRQMQERYGISLSSVDGEQHCPLRFKQTLILILH